MSAVSLLCSSFLSLALALSPFAQVQRPAEEPKLRADVANLKAFALQFRDLLPADYYPVNTPINTRSIPSVILDFVGGFSVGINDLLTLLEPGPRSGKYPVYIRGYPLVCQRVLNRLLI